MDLKQFRTVYILHMVDHATRYSAAAIISSKQKDVIIDKIFKYWIVIFGTPNLFLSNNEGEFNNELFREMGKQLNIILKLLLQNLHGPMALQKGKIELLGIWWKK